VRIKVKGLKELDDAVYWKHRQTPAAKGINNKQLGKMEKENGKRRWEGVKTRCRRRRQKKAHQRVERQTSLTVL